MGKFRLIAVAYLKMFMQPLLKDTFAPAVVAETETLVHDSLIRQAGAHLQRLTRRDSLRPERDAAEALRLLHLLLWYLTARKGISAAFMEGESRKRIREVRGCLENVQPAACKKKCPLV